MRDGDFRALAGGVRDTDGTFYFLDATAFFWIATERDADFAFYRSIYSGMAVVDMGAYNKGVAMSVRCVGDME